MTIEFKEAWVIELFDAQIYIANDYETSGIVNPNDALALSIDGEELESLFLHMGVDTSDYMSSTGTVKLANQSFKINRNLAAHWVMELDSNAKIEAAIAAPGVLDIRLSYKDVDGHHSMDRFTYCGHFAVYWKD